MGLSAGDVDVEGTVQLKCIGARKHGMNWLSGHNLARAEELHAQRFGIAPIAQRQTQFTRFRELGRNASREFFNLNLLNHFR